MPHEEPRVDNEQRGVADRCPVAVDNPRSQRRSELRTLTPVDVADHRRDRYQTETDVHAYSQLMANTPGRSARGSSPTTPVSNTTSRPQEWSLGLDSPGGNVRLAGTGLRMVCAGVEFQRFVVVHSVLSCDNLPNGSPIGIGAPPDRTSRDPASDTPIEERSALLGDKPFRVRGTTGSATDPNRLDLDAIGLQCADSIKVLVGQIERRGHNQKGLARLKAVAICNKGRSRRSAGRTSGSLLGAAKAARSGPPTLLFSAVIEASSGRSSGCPCNCRTHSPVALKRRHHRREMVDLVSAWGVPWRWVVLAPGGRTERPRAAICWRISRPSSTSWAA